MAFPLSGTEDDASNVGTNNVPSSSGAETSRPPQGQASAGGQRQGTGPGSNPTATDLRQYNPLSKFSSYTYNLTLYILTPEAANYYSENSELPSNEGDGRYFIVAQSGGINSNTESRGLTLDKNSAPGPGRPGLDFFIDDLAIESFMMGKDNSKTATEATTINFKIIEPAGFTFLTKLSRLSSQINQISNLIKSGDVEAMPNLYQHHYMIGIRFYGYDVDGKVIEASDVPDARPVLNDKYAVYQRLFPVMGNYVAFKISGRSTIYSWETTVLNLKVSYGNVRGRVSNPASLAGSTVGEILGSKSEKNEKSLMGYLNARQLDNKNQKKIEKEQTYDIKWIDNQWFDGSKIRNSKIVTDATVEKQAAPMMDNKTVQESNVATSTKAVSIDTKSKTLNIPAGIAIVNAIDQIIVKSSYVVDTLIKEINAEVEAKTMSNSSGKLYWYSIKPIAKCRGRDATTKDWVYDITYEIAPWEIPYIKSQYVVATSKWYGPIKKYAYTLTGENTEVISFEMDYNNLYYVITPETVTEDNSSKSTKTLSNVTPRHPSGAVNSNPTIGKGNKGSLMAENVRASLYSEADQAKASIRILGDPDLLMDSGGSEYQSESFSKFYGKNDSINPYGGQIFIEIIFKVAEDYKDNGLLDVDLNQTIAFYPAETQKLLGNTGIIYEIISVNSTFSKGKFEQVLNLVMVQPEELITKDKVATNQRVENSSPNQNTAGSVTQAPVSTAQERFRRAEISQPGPAPSVPVTNNRLPPINPYIDPAIDALMQDANMMTLPSPEANTRPLRRTDRADDDANSGGWNLIETPFP